MVLTSYPGQQLDPTLSPDGKQVAFSWNGEKGDNFDIYVKLVDAGTPVRLTQDPALDTLPAWSPDSRFLAFVRLSPEGKGGYYVIPALGGAERKIADIPQTPSHSPVPSADWTADSKSLVIVDASADPPALVQVSVADGDKKRLTSPPGSSMGDYSPAMSPDGRWLAFNRVPGANLQSWRVVSFTQAATGQPIPIPLPISETGFPIHARCAWTADSAQLVCVEEGTGGSRLVRVPVPGPGKPEPILAAGTNVSEPTIARQAGRLAYAHAFRNTNLWRADLREPKAPPVRGSPTILPMAAGSHSYRRDLVQTKYGPRVQTDLIPFRSPRRPCVRRRRAGRRTAGVSPLRSGLPGISTSMWWMRRAGRRGG